MRSVIQFLLNALRTTVQNIRSNRQVFFVSVATITIALSILGLFLLIFINLNTFLASWNQEVQLIVYLKDDISQAAKADLEKQFQNHPEVAHVGQVSRDQAWEQFKGSFSGASEFLRGLKFNPLPASFHLRFNESSNRLQAIRALAKELNGKPGVESTEYGEQWIAGFEKFMIFIQVFFLAVGGLLLLGLILIISNTIKLSYYSRQEEIELMLMIGATPRFIKMPFLVEGMLEGVVGALSALGLLKALHWYVGSRIETSLDFMTRGLEFQFIPLPMAGGLVLLSLVIGWLGSYLSIRQFVGGDK